MRNGLDTYIILTSNANMQTTEAAELLTERNKMTITIKSSEFNSDLAGFILTLDDGRTVQVQFNKEQNRLHADFGTYYPVIDTENEYGLNLSDEETEEVKEYIRSNAKAMIFDAGLSEEAQ